MFSKKSAETELRDLQKHREEVEEIFIGLDDGSAAGVSDKQGGEVTSSLFPAWTVSGDVTLQRVCVRVCACVCVPWRGASVEAIKCVK